MTLYVGVDVGKQTVVVATCGDEVEQDLGTFGNDAQGFEYLMAAVSAEVQGEETVHLVLEPTGSYHLSLVAVAYEQGWLVSLPNPKQVCDFAKGMGRRAKTDKVDARMLARFGQQCQPTSQQPLPEEVQALESLLRRKEDLEQMLAQERNRQESLAHQPAAPQRVSDNVAQVEQALGTALADVEAAIESLLAEQPELRQQRRHLMTVPGIGERNVLHLLVLLYRWEAHTAGEGNAKGLTAYVGLDPVAYQSGTSVHRRAATSKMGSASLRRRLYLSALGGTKARHTPLTVFYQRLLSHDKPKMVALIACARKILVWAFAIFRSDSIFQPELAMPQIDA